MDNPASTHQSQTKPLELRGASEGKLATDPGKLDFDMKSHKLVDAGPGFPQSPTRSIVNRLCAHTKRMLGITKDYTFK